MTSFVRCHAMFHRSQSKGNYHKKKDLKQKHLQDKGIKSYYLHTWIELTSAMAFCPPLKYEKTEKQRG